MTNTHDKWANPQKMWDERFSEVVPVYGEQPNQFLREQASRLKAGMKVLVPADGYGRNGVWLAKQGLQVHTVDLSPVGVERARKLARAAGVDMIIELADLSAWNWPVDEFDAAASIFLHLLPDVRPKIHSNILRAVKRGGLVLLEAFTPAQLRHSSGGPKQVELLYTAEILRQDFAQAAPLLLEEKETVLDEGHMHRGTVAVVRAVFQRR
ncbi:MAG TPA: class I SAM-dependent methyltransferase [Candidatus Limnocylindrales bacterium]|nr:class I SAM-dependent methyltransferase [Candidatus Limnocylindrales bacterium]